MISEARNQKSELEMSSQIPGMQYRALDYFLDLRGIECPLNFVKAKIQLDVMQEGQILEVLLDPGEAIESVPPSVTEEGHEILLITEYNDYFRLLIRKSVHI